MAEGEAEGVSGDTFKHQHFVKKCSCGAVIAQCRCFSKDKLETVALFGCENCRKAHQEIASAPELPEGA